MSTATTFWRLAGMTYLEYASRATSVVRSALKEPARSQALAREAVTYNRNIFTGGVPGGKLPVENLAQAGGPKVA
ncbi:unnamed protein product [Discosporangium mesarthrocarpum]